MIAVVQRVRSASVLVEGQVVGSIGVGLCVFVGVQRGDVEASATAMASKLAKLRIFPDSDGKMNRSVIEVGGGVLLVSQFTLAGDTSGGNRPSFIDAAPPEAAEPLYDRVVELLRSQVAEVGTGRFRTHMDVMIHNDRPVTILVRT